MDDESDTIDSIVAAAIELASAEERAGFIRSQCGSDIELCQRTERLVAAYFRAGNFLESPPPSLADATAWDHTESLGSVIGRYKLVQQIGEGGFGSVYLAEQTEPVRRQVALKIIKLGMDTRNVIARFEAERQAPAMMDHDGIAKVLDAGATESGRPYFVMELVKGEPITDYCATHQLVLRARLVLFEQVCQAVQHAHQKGIIHRDLKPNNVLITTQDDRPICKVIDFGVAKAMEGHLPEKTFFTDVQQLIGTPAYMSPEQADGSLDVDTRSDVYSLGVLLYELLAGAPPFEPQELRSKAFAEMQRIIREVEPPTPSTRLSKQASSQLGVSARSHGGADDLSQSENADRRAKDVHRLAAAVRGELDWIVMRCLEKDRVRRYQTASSLADDVRRFLEDQPVEARPPTRSYRLRKFARRNRGFLAAVGLIGLTLAAAATVSTWQAIRAARSEKLARVNEMQAVANADRAEAISDFLVQAFRSPDPRRDGRTVTIAEVLDRAGSEMDAKYQDDPALKAALLDALSKTYSSLGLYEKSIPLSEEALRLRRQTFGESHPETLSTMSTLAHAYSRTGNSAESVKLAEQVLVLRQASSGPLDTETIRAMVSLSTIYRSADQKAKAMPMADLAAELFTRTLGPEDKDTLRARHEVLAAYGDAMGQGLVDSKPYEFEDLLEPMVKAVGEEDPLTLSLMDNIALSAFRGHRYEFAREMWKKTFKLRIAKLGPAHSDTIRTARLLAQLYNERDSPSQALAEIDEFLTIAPEDAELQAARRTALSRMRPIEEIAKDFVTKIRDSRDETAYWAPRKVVCCELASNPKLFEAVVKLIPEETTLWIGRGQYHLLRNRFSEAAADYARVIDRRPLHDEYFEYGCLLLLCGDIPAYQRFCREVSERNSDSKDGYVAYALSNLLALGPAECVSPDRVVEWATIATRERRWWELQTLGLAHLRAGQLSEAVAVYEESLETKHENRGPGESYFGLAIAYHGLGKTAQAEQALQQGRDILKRCQPIHDNEPAGAQSWHWLLLNRLAREAEATFGASPGSPAGPSSLPRQSAPAKK